MFVIDITLGYLKYKMFIFQLLVNVVRVFHYFRLSMIMESSLLCSKTSLDGGIQSFLGNNNKMLRYHQTLDTFYFILGNKLHKTYCLSNITNLHWTISQEFYLHILNVMERENKKIGKANHAYQSLQFKVEDRLECGSSNQVLLPYNWARDCNQF